MDVATGQIFDIVFNNLPTPILVVKANPPLFTVLALNKAYRQTTSTSIENAVGRPVFEVYKPRDTASRQHFKLLESGLLKVIHTKEPLEFPTLAFDAPTPAGDVKTWWQ